MRSIEFRLSDIHEDIKQHMIDCGRIFAKTKLNNITSDNESVVLNDSAKHIDELKMYITRGGSKLGHLDEPIAIIRISLGGYDGNMMLASSEADIHKEIHRRRLRENPELNSSACAHAHTLSAVALSMRFEKAGAKEIEIPREYRTARLGKAVPIITSQYGSGAEDMVENMPGILVDHPGLVPGNHGAFAVGENLEETLRFLMELESASEKMIPDLTTPRKFQKIESMVPDDWFKKIFCRRAFGLRIPRGRQNLAEDHRGVGKRTQQCYKRAGLGPKEVSGRNFRRIKKDMTGLTFQWIPSKGEA